MFIDTHCHLQNIIKDAFDKPLSPENITSCKEIADQAFMNKVTKIINIGTSKIESDNSVVLAKNIDFVYAVIGIHPNDATEYWQDDIAHLKKYLDKKDDNKIVGIGECGIDRHYEGYNLQRQQDVFKTQIEMALEHDLALVVHTRDAGDETLRSLEQFKDAKLRGTIHCFSEDLSFANDALSMGFVLGIGGTVTYPKNTILRDVVKNVGLENIILETDAPFLSPQIVRGTKNYPKNIVLIAEYIAQLLAIPLETIAQKTTANAHRIFRI